MLIYILTVVIIVTLNESVSSSDLSKTIPKDEPLPLRVVIKPNGNKWKILRYECLHKKCTLKCIAGDVCKHICDCSFFGYVNTLLPSSCEMSNVKECKELCFRSRCREFCRMKLIKKCRNISG